MSTAATAPKVRALSARPEVALAIDAGDSSAKALSVRGVVHLTIVDGVVPECLAAPRKNLDAEYAAEFERNCRAMYHQMARIAVEPQWARFYDFGAGRMPQCRAAARRRPRRVPRRTRQEGELTIPPQRFLTAGCALWISPPLLSTPRRQARAISPHRPRCTRVGAGRPGVRSRGPWQATSARSFSAAVLAWASPPR
ncbi:hypothetical protein [Streptomyces sp. MMG1121]|uniref:hypothetical protein n=1 Tax=Streptomyces sp. MMG1121 TaxID=1415544 RepID=UPI002D21D883|nr:hypothetical protein [Streptomyces sp. MMG1121]